VLAEPSALDESCSILATGFPSRIQAGLTGQELQLLVSSRPRTLGLIATLDMVAINLG
jgi:hypothetical protein